MGFLRRKEPDAAAAPDPPDGLTMTVQEVFWIGAPPDVKLDPARQKLAQKFPGTVVMGELTGSGTLVPGDLLIDGDDRLQVRQIEAFKQLLDRAEPPRVIALRLGTEVDRSRFSSGQQIHFVRPS